MTAIVEAQKLFQQGMPELNMNPHVDTGLAASSSLGGKEMWYQGVSTALPVSHPHLLTMLHGGGRFHLINLVCFILCKSHTFSSRLMFFWGDKGCMLWKGTGETEPSVSRRVAECSFFIFPSSRHSTYSQNFSIPVLPLCSHPHLQRQLSQVMWVTLIEH